MDTPAIQIRIYQLPDGRIPYLQWLWRLKDAQAKEKIRARIYRLELGNFGPTRSVGEGVQELKIHYGPGYRVYFGQEGKEIVILLCGGDKCSQDKDIREARHYWANYKKDKKYANN